MLITQYILNLDKRNFKYVGSGTIFVDGSAIYSQIFNGTYSQQFYVGEYVYDSNHVIWQIVSITGDATNPVYNATSGGETKSFSQNEIIKLNQEGQYFNSQYDAQISSYEQTIQKIDSIIPPPDVDNSGSIYSEFVVGEYVYDSNHIIWQIISISGDKNNILYTVMANGQTAVLTSGQIFKLNSESNYFDTKYDNQIIAYDEVIQKIDSIVPPPDVYNTGSVTPKFDVGEYVIDNRNSLWIVLNIESNVNNIYYTIYNDTGAKLVAENDIYKLNEESKVMGEIYDQQIVNYQLLLNQINEKIINF